MGQVVGPGGNGRLWCHRPLPLVAWWAFLWVSHGMPRHSTGVGGGRVLVLPDLGPSAVLGSPGLSRDQFLCLKNNLVSFPAYGGGFTHRTFRAGRKE